MSFFSCSSGRVSLRALDLRVVGFQRGVLLRDVGLEAGDGRQMLFDLALRLAVALLDQHRIGALGPVERLVGIAA